MSDFENREEANMKIHIGDERFTKDGMTNCLNFPREWEKCRLTLGDSTLSFCNGIDYYFFNPVL